VHVANVSARGSGGLALRHSLRSRTRYAARHWNRPRTAALVALTIAVELPLRLARAAPGGRAELREVAGAAWSYLRFILIPGEREPAVPPADADPPASAALSAQGSRST
jgi:N-acetylglucosaminyl-diphospho-decaprenol L-rhamnosyltransferase